MKAYIYEDISLLVHVERATAVPAYIQISFTLTLSRPRKKRIILSHFFSITTIGGSQWSLMKRGIVNEFFLVFVKYIYIRASGSFSHKINCFHDSLSSWTPFIVRNLNIFFIYYRTENVDDNLLSSWVKWQCWVVEKRAFIFVFALSTKIFTSIR